MAAPQRCTVTINGTQMRALAGEVDFGAEDDEHGMPAMGTQRLKICAWFDIHNNPDIPFSQLQTLFELSFRPEAANMADIAVEFWGDEEFSDAICVFSFSGWIRRMRVADFALPEAAVGVADALADVNHLLYLELLPALGEDNIREITIGN